MSQAQYEVVGTPYHNKNNTSTSLEDNFQEYSLYKIDLNNLRDDYKRQDDFTLSLKLGKSINAEVVLFKNDILASGYNVITDGGKTIDISSADLVEHYEGYILDDAQSEIRISIGDGYMYGYIQQGNIRKYIEPANTFNKALSNEIMIVYDQTKVVAKKGNICAASHVERQEAKVVDTKATSCAVLDIAVALDNSYVQAYGSSTSAINQSIAILNMVEPNYASNAFSKNFKFSIVQHYVPSGADPWTTSADAVTLLNSFTSWGPSNFTATHDIGQFWTNRDMYFVDPTSQVRNYSVAGLAWVGTVCGGARYHILEDFTSSAWQLRVLTSHEMGHNFGSNHDTGAGNIMASSISSNTNTWSAVSRSAINTALSGFNCFAECQVGSCSDISNVAISNCAVGNPSTYSLTIEVLHGGGAAGSSGFNVLVDGGTFFQPWSASPQTVVINNLTSDGTTNQTITIQADNGTDSGCNATATYDEPRADCALEVVENFNNCEKPLGWTTTTTQPTTINGGDPLVQYEWKFLGTNRTYGNYSSYNNGQTTRTIDGTCMAIMDDDIFNPSWYSGIVVLQSPNFALSQYENIVLEFDYLFHPFEDGGKGANNSYFRVEVWDGGKYVTILNDGDSSCGWTDVWQTSCMDKPSIDITLYRNDELHVRFTYSDGNTGSWAGMAAVDNFKISGDLISFGPPDGLESDCDMVKTVSGSSIEGTFVAEQMVNTNGITMVDGSTIFSATTVELKPGFEVGGSTEFTVDNNGCSNL